jgi:tRNA/rRNA methyltransferase/tRNA (cytidine32/uridine32-2'-O)-methyltransferase
VAEHRLANVCVVLVEPQDPVNIAAVVRAMKNMGVARLRLVNPVEYDATRIELVAHGTRDVVAGIAHFGRLADAVADCVRVAAFTARRRAAKRLPVTPREAAAELAAFLDHGPVALLFGREDHGLPNDALDRAQLVVTIPTTAHASLNLAQAVLIGLYEMHAAHPAATRTLAPPRKDAPPAASEHFEQFFADAGRALDACDFFRTRNPEHVMRTVRSLAYRAAPDAREIGLLRAMAIEVVRAIDRLRRP